MLEIRDLDMVTLMDVSDSDIKKIENMVGMGKEAWGLVDHQELVWACFQVLARKIEGESDQWG